MPRPDLTFTLSNDWRYKSVSPLEDRSVGSSRERLEILNDVPEGFTVTQFSPVTGRAVHMKDALPQDLNLYIK